MPLTTELDPRYSSPDAEATDWEVVRKAVADADIFWITTVRDSGRPHVTPLVAVWLNEALHFCTGADEQKAVNLRTNPQVILTTGCNDWQTGLDVVVEGEAVRVTDEGMLRRLARVGRKSGTGAGITRWGLACSSTKVAKRLCSGLSPARFSASTR